MFLEIIHSCFFLKGEINMSWFTSRVIIDAGTALIWNNKDHYCMILEEVLVARFTIWTWLYPSSLIPLLSSSLLLLLLLAPSSGTYFLILVRSCSLCDMLGIDWNNSGQVLISGGALFLMLRNSYQLILLIPRCIMRLSRLQEVCNLS